MPNIRISMTMLAALLTVVAGAGCASTTPAAMPAPSQAETPEVQVITKVDTVYIETDPVMYLLNAEEGQPGRFDRGKMWTFDNPPLEYFQEAYGFQPDDSWFEKARQGALRLPNCSASFVSANGLVMTNHHCSRDAIVTASEPGEDLLNKGFIATNLDQERKIPDFHADQLISIRDVTSDVNAAIDEQLAAGQSEVDREAVVESIESMLLEAAGGEDAGMVVEVIPLYDGSQYSAYTFRRFDDVRAVVVPELQIGYYGGDYDNFTYPRYNLDFSFLRVYVDNKPYQPTSFFGWDNDGLKEGDAVFVIGNPGSTSRSQTMSQLKYRRDVGDRVIMDLIQTRLVPLQAFREKHPAMADSLDIVNTIFGLENQLKAMMGQMGGLNNPALMARKRNAENAFIKAIAKDSTLAAKYGDAHEEMANLNERLAETGPMFAAYVVNPEADLFSGVIRRATFGFYYAATIASGQSPEVVAELKESILAIKSYPREIEIAMVAQRLRDIVGNVSDPAIEAMLRGTDPESLATEIYDNSITADSASFADGLGAFASSGDPAMPLGQAMLQGIFGLQQGTGAIQEQITDVSRRLSDASFEVYGTSFPPDASFSLRVADGVVAEYEYNGTKAPAFTTFYGMYDRHYSHKQEFPWSLPERWANPPEGFDMSTPMNLVSTNDIIGGNSGSPLLDAELEVVGLIFDGNVESLPGEFIYTEEGARSISVDARGIIEALDFIYDADRVVLELTKGRFVETEAEADEGMRN